MRSTNWPFDADNPPDIAIERGHATAFLRPVEGLPLEQQDPDEAPSIVDAIDNAIDARRFDVVEQLVKHI